MLFAAQILAMSAIDLFENADIVAKAKSEHAKASEDGYVCPIPADEHAKAVEL